MVLQNTGKDIAVIISVDLENMVAPEMAGIVLEGMDITGIADIQNVANNKVEVVNTVRKDATIQDAMAKDALNVLIVSVDLIMLVMDPKGLDIAGTVAKDIIPVMAEAPAIKVPMDPEATTVLRVVIMNLPEATMVHRVDIMDMRNFLSTSSRSIKMATKKSARKKLSNVSRKHSTRWTPTGMVR